MKNYLKITFLALSMLVIATVANAQSRVVFDGNKVCIRSSATVNAHNVMGYGYKKNGDSYPYIGTYGSFYCINYYGSYGYVHKSYSHVVDTYTTSRPRQTSSKTFAHITGNNVRIRTSPSYNGGVCGSCNRGDYFVYLGFYGDWVQIKYAGKTRYVHSDFVSVY